MTFEDRVPTYPGRVILVPVPGQANTYDMVRADEPLVEGTPINKALFDSIMSKIEAVNLNVANIINDHAQKSFIGLLAIGTEFGIFENGVLVPFIKVSGDYGGTGRNAVMRKHIYKLDYLNNSSEGNKYANSKTDLWLNNDYFNSLDSLTRSGIEEVPIVYTVGGGKYSTATINRKIFLASATEYGFTDTSDFNVEGSPFPYFSSESRRIAQYNGEAEAHWMRSAHRTANGLSGLVAWDGTPDTQNSYSYRFGIRPVFTLPSDFEVNLNISDTTNVMATGEVI